MSQTYISDEEVELREQIEQSEKVLRGFEHELAEVDAKLDKLAERNRQYEALADVCAAVEALDAIDGTRLFWNDAEAPARAREQLGYAASNQEAFRAEIGVFEDRRRAIVEKIDDQNDVLDYLHYDLQDAIDREESRRGEWEIEREPEPLPHRAQVMPWTRGWEEDQRFRKSLAGSIAASIAIAFLAGTIAVPIAERVLAPQLPERVARLVRQERTPPPPPVEQPMVAEEEPLPDPEPIDETIPEEAPVATEQPVVAEAEPDTREQVKSKGILAFRDSFASRANLRPTAQLGSQARVRQAGQTAVGRPERMLVATSAPGSSGGINLSDISRDVGGGGEGLEGVAVSRVESSIGGADGPDRPLSGGVSAGRTDEEIQIVFDRYKAALYRLYNRELRKDPTLRGQMVLKLTIEPDGSVSLCEMQSSDMDAPDLVQQVVNRVLTFDFGAKEDIVAMTIIYPIDFLPAA